MDKGETAKIMGIISMNYSEKLLPAVWVTNQSMATELWTDLLNDLDYNQVKAAVLILIMTKDYPPTIAEIRNTIAKESTQHIVTAEEAWGQIQKAVRKFGYTDEQGAKAFLQEDIRLIVERFGWTYFCMMPIDDTSTYFAQFRNAYNCEVQKKIEKIQIPAALKAALSGIGTGGRIQLPEKVEVTDE